MENDAAGYILFVGDDDFLVNREARARWEKESAEAFDDMSKDVIEGTALGVDDIAEIVDKFIESLRTLPLFGGKKYVWLRNVNWLSEGRLVDSEKTANAVKRLAEEAATLDGNAVCTLISVIKPDKRRTVTKQLLKCGELNAVAGGGDPEELFIGLENEARKLGVKIDDDALRLLVDKVNRHTRMSYVELGKLACYVGQGGTIDAGTVLSLVPVFGEGDFFEPVELFFTGDLEKTLAALRSYFFNNDSARPLLSAMQKRNSLLIQLRALLDAGDVRLNFRGEIPKGEISAAGERYGQMFGGNNEKSGYNLFSQNAWYVGAKIAGTLKNRAVTLKRLIDWQLDFLKAFEALIARPREDEAVMCELVSRCLSR